MSAFRQPALLDRRLVSAEMAALTYALFSLADLVFTSIAFFISVPEGNPMLAWLAGHHLFVPAKISLTLVAAAMIELYYNARPIRLIAWAGVGVMVALTVYHIWGLALRLGGIW